MSTPEEASDYLTRTNFKSIIEWLTAEAILNRPEDPMVPPSSLHPLSRRCHTRTSRGLLGRAGWQALALVPCATTLDG